MLDPASAGTFVNLGTIHFHLRDWDAAERNYRQALVADPRYALAQFNLGNLFDERGDRALALVHYMVALRLDANYADAHYNVALLYQSSGQLMRAVRHWKAYLKLDSSSAWAAIARQELDRLRHATLIQGSKRQLYSEVGVIVVKARVLAVRHKALGRASWRHGRCALSVCAASGLGVTCYHSADGRSNSSLASAAETLMCVLFLPRFEGSSLLSCYRTRIAIFEASAPTNGTGAHSLHV